MRKGWIMLLVVLWGAAIFQVIESRAVTQEKKMIEVFHQVDSEMKSSVVEFYGIYKEDYLTLENREAYLKEIAKQLGITEGMTLEKTYDSQRQEVKLVKQARRAKTVLRFVTIEDETSTKQFILARISLDKDMESTLVHKRKLEDILESDTKECRSSANVIGLYEGNLDLAKRNEIASNLLNSMGARVVSEYKDMQLYTIYGYASYITDYVMQGDEAVNVNVAMNYNEREDKTYVYVAIPLVGLDY